MIGDRKWLLILIGSAVLVYSIIVLCFIVTTPDVGLRLRVADEESPPEAPHEGLPIHPTPHMIAEGRTPQVGDRLLKLWKFETHSFVDFAYLFIKLRNAQSNNGPLSEGENLLEAVVVMGHPELVEYSGGERWVKSQYLRPSTGERFTTYLKVQSLPLKDVFLSFIWFSLQLGFFFLSALLCWNRPFDRAARVLFGLGIVSLGAFIAGNHWWVMATNLWIIVPCAICAILLPAVLLHFSIVFPRPKVFMQQHPGLTLTAIYLLPKLATLATLFVVRTIRRLHSPGHDANLPQLIPWLEGLRIGIYGYVCVAAVYYVLSLVALWNSRKRVQQSQEREQLRWIWGGGVLASVFVATALVLAFVDRVNFALGSGRLPMFLATITFLGAFSMAMIRHHLMQINQIISRNMLYYVASWGLTGIISLIIALSILVPQWFHLSLSTQQALTVAGMLTLTVIVLMWLRDLFQQMIDRQFFQNRYRLDNALKRIQQSVAKLSDPQATAQLFLSSCRDVLGVERGALFLRTGGDEPFRLMAKSGRGEAPAQLPLDAPFLSTLKDQGSLQRVTPASRNRLSAEQALLWELDVDLVHGLETAEGIAGLVLLGQKRDGASFTSEDLTFLNALGQIANVAMYSAQVVDQNISRLNEELQLKLEKITDQQRQIALLQAQLTQINEASPRSSAKNGTFRREEFKGSSPAIRAVLETARKVAASESSVLLRGESGTGKEVLAQVLHNNSPRAGKPMVRVNCASLSSSLLESELFGHVKGAFTGAHQDRVGRFEAAHGGSLFLDEIGDISHETQIKLLRVLQERCFEPVGSVRTVQVNVRLITATHQNLEQLIQQGKFREDLFYRLNVISMELPALRQRREDIFELALHFLGRAAKRLGKTVTHIDDEALQLLERYPWPGNIRELENVIERAVVMVEGTVITSEDLPTEVLSADAPARGEIPPATTAEPPGWEKIGAALPLEMPGEAGSVNGSLESPPEKKRGKNGPPERQELLAALAECQGNKAQAARLLGLPRSTFFSQLKRHGIA